jgi:YggT family protein
MSPALASLIIHLLGLLSQLLGLLWIVVIAASIVSWLIVFDVINTRNRTVYQIVSILNSVSDRLLYPIRRFVPPLGTLDISPFVFLIIILVLQAIIRSLQMQLGLSLGGI